MRDKNGMYLNQAEILTKIKNRLSNYILDFELMLLRWAGHIPFHTIRKIIYRLAGIKIGKGSNIHMWANFFNPRNISIGDDTIIGDHVFLDGRDSLSIGNHVDIASNVMIYNSEHNINDENFTAVEQEVIISDYVFVGPRSIILPGVKIGKGAVIAAGAVVNENIGDFDIVGGIPAKFISKRKVMNLNYHLGRARLFQ